jgi:plasmid stabilization system protein ParE
MTFTVRELPKAKQDIRSIFAWLHQHSPAGAAAWLDAYDALIERLSRDAESFGAAQERRDCDCPYARRCSKRIGEEFTESSISSKGMTCSCSVSADQGRRRCGPRIFGEACRQQPWR